MSAKKLLQFLQRYPNSWHTLGGSGHPNSPVKKAAKNLERRGLIEIARHGGEFGRDWQAKLLPEKSREINPKKKIPAALARYWAKRRAEEKRSPIPMNKFARRKKSVRDPAHKKLVRQLSSHFASDEAMMRSKRKKNPFANPAAHRGYKLVIVTPSGRLHYAGGKFSAKLPPVIFPTSESARGAALEMRAKHSVLKRYSFLASPVR